MKFVAGVVLYSNLFIAICAMAITANGFLLLGIQPRLNYFSLFTGSATLFIYMLIRLAAVKRISNYEPDPRWEFFLKNIKSMRMITVLAFASSAILYFLLPRAVEYALILPGVISVVYGLPLGKKFRLRDVGMIKIFLISFVWGYIGAILPAVQSDLPVFSPEVMLLFTADFCFIFAITLPFDIKDMKIDAISNVKTIPAYIGANLTYALSMLLLFICAILFVMMQRNGPMEIDYSYSILFSILIAGIVIWVSSSKKNNLVYFGLLDGCILLQFLLCYFYGQIVN